ncbi:SPT2-like protein [Alligator mississippiensis]|uniref:Protein SPT2 homolog n=1 Tax=Alligator mississippiensis TaxID=8496 RepID=A0A151MC83_ALLMI|nr:SPT2-like protein [Alligator mississippiensis]
MDFRDVLLVASEHQGGSAPPKRYSLAVGPPKKVPKVKGVESAAVQAFLRRKEEEKKKKEREEKKRKEELLAKRVELKHDRKARAMASRTKDNFYGYNGIPIEEKPRKRRTSENVSRGTDAEYTTGDETEQFEYSQTESEHEPEEYEEKPSKATAKPKAPPKSAAAPMNFTDLLRLAEKKQYEPVEIKVVKKLNGMRPLPGHRPPGFPPQGLPRPSLPPISYKRQICDEEDDSDSEMDDFIEDEGDSQEEISKHIREIFGYDRKRYKDESDYALRYMESSWKEQQKEEARSLRLGVQEDLEEMKREEEEWKRKKQAKKLKTH